VALHGTFLLAGIRDRGKKTGSASRETGELAVNSSRAETQF